MSEKEHNAGLQSGEQAVQYIVTVPAPVEKQISPLNLWNVIIGEIWLVVAITVFVTVVSGVYAFVATPIYRVEVLLEPSHEDGGSSSASLGQLGSLASLAGLNVDSRSDSRQGNLAVLRSRQFAESFILEEKLMPVLFESDWDAEREQWNVESKEEIPVMWDAVDLFRRRVVFVTDDNITGLVTVAVEWKDPALAAHWANLLVQRINDRLRSQAIADAEANLNYLIGELEKARFVELREVIAKIQEVQIERIMLAKGRSEFAFEVIDPAVVPPLGEFVKPNRSVLILAGGSLGALFGMFLALFRNYIRRDPEASD